MIMGVVFFNYENFGNIRRHCRGLWKPKNRQLWLRRGVIKQMNRVSQRESATGWSRHRSRLKLRGIGDGECRSFEIC